MQFTKAHNRFPNLAPAGVNRSLKPGWCGLVLLGCLALICACGELRPVPATFEPQDYTFIEYQDLLHPRRAGLHAGQKIRLKAFFWEYLTYDPALVENYLTLPRYPIRWYQLRWFATYGTEAMTGYYDLAALSPEQAQQYHLTRMEPIVIYGELSPLGQGLYLRVHHLEKIEAD
jgi:hypothetical protein